MDPPADSIKKSIIESLASAVVTQGKHVEEELRNAQHDNPLYSFLFFGEGHDYYKFMLSVESIEWRRARKTTKRPKLNQPSGSTSIHLSEIPQPPADEKVRLILETTAARAVLEGNEDLIKESERNNPLFSFIFGGEHHRYYQYCVTLKEVEMKTHRKQSQDREKGKYAVLPKRRCHQPVDRDPHDCQEPLDATQEPLNVQVIGSNRGEQEASILQQLPTPSTAVLHPSGNEHSEEQRQTQEISHFHLSEEELCSDNSNEFSPTEVNSGDPKALPAKLQIESGRNKVGSSLPSARPTLTEQGLPPFESTVETFHQLGIQATPSLQIEEINSVEALPENEGLEEADDNVIIENYEKDNDEFMRVPPESFTELNKDMADFKRPIYKEPSSTPAEIMHNMLVLSRMHHWSATEQSHVMMLVNSAFKTQVVPDSRHLLDKYLVCSEGISYHFYCDCCYNLFKNVDVGVTKQLECCDKVLRISDLTKANYFITLDTRLGIQNFLKNEKISKAFVEFFENKRYSGSPDGVLRDLYDGVMYQSFRSRISKTANAGVKDLSYTLCTDGTPIYRSSNCSIWPLFFMINELPPKLRMHNLLLGGLWFGNNKPKMNIFFDPVVDHLKQLSKGFCVNVQDSEWLLRVHNISCCVDSGARGSVQGIHAHNGSYGCNFCLHPGQGVGPARYYPLLEYIPEERTAQEIIDDAIEAQRTNKPVHGVLGITRLAGAPLYDIASGMILDHLHNFNLGVGRQFTKAWFGADGAKTKYYVGQPSYLALLNIRIKMLRPATELRKYPRSMDVLSYWSGLEWENWVLYFSIPVLEGILPDEYLNHWAHFVLAVRLLLQSEISQGDIRHAHALLSEFIRKVQLLYCDEEDLHHMTFNLHLLSHAAKNVTNWGPQWAISAYAFEAGNGDLKKNIHANRGISSQICRSISHTNAMRELENASDTTAIKSFKKKLEFGQHKMKETCVGQLKFLGNSAAFTFGAEEQWLLQQAGYEAEDFRSYEKVVFNGIVFASGTWKHQQRKTDNSYALTKSGNIIHIETIILQDNGHVSFAIVHRVRCSHHKVTRLLRAHSFKCGLLHCMDGTDVDKSLLPIWDLKSKFVSIDVGNGHVLSQVVYNHNTV